MQPHTPYLGSASENVETGGFTGGGVIKDEREIKSIFKRRAFSEIDVKPVREAYNETLEIALESVGNLVDELNGKTVVSADHGEAFRERDIWPSKKCSYRYFDSSAWLTTEYQGRKHIESNENTIGTSSEMKSEEIKDRLADLGYK